MLSRRRSDSRIPSWEQPSLLPMPPEETDGRTDGQPEVHWSLLFAKLGVGGVGNLFSNPLPHPPSSSPPPPPPLWPRRSSKNKRRGREPAGRWEESGNAMGDPAEARTQPTPQKKSPPEPPSQEGGGPGCAPGDPLPSRRGTERRRPRQAADRQTDRQAWGGEGGAGTGGVCEGRGSGSGLNWNSRVAPPGFSRVFLSAFICFLLVVDCFFTVFPHS